MDKINEILGKLNDRELSEVRLDYNRDGKFVKVNMISKFKIKGEECFVVEDEHFEDSYKRRVEPIEKLINTTKRGLEIEVTNYLRGKLGKRRYKSAYINKYTIQIKDPVKDFHYFLKLEVGVQATADTIQIQDKANKKDLPPTNKMLSAYEGSSCVSIETVVVTMSNQEDGKASSFKKNAEKVKQFDRKINEKGTIELTHEEYLKLNDFINKTVKSTIR